MVRNHRTNIRSWSFLSMHSSSGQPYTLPPKLYTYGTYPNCEYSIGILQWAKYTEQMHLRMSLHWICHQNRSFIQMKSDVKPRFDSLWRDTLDWMNNTTLKRDELQFYRLFLFLMFICVALSSKSVYFCWSAVLWCGEFIIDIVFTVSVSRLMDTHECEVKVLVQ